MTEEELRNKIWYIITPPSPSKLEIVVALTQLAQTYAGEHLKEALLNLANNEDARKLFNTLLLPKSGKLENLQFDECHDHVKLEESGE